MALSQAEIGELLRGIYQSSIRRPYKLALHLLVLCMIRKGELIGARWDEIDFEKSEWLIPAERISKDKPHLVPLCKQTVAMFEELRGLASKSPWVLPSRNTLKDPIAHSTLNQAIRSLDLGIRDFVIHDFRRTASTQLHEAGFNSDWIEKALAHEQKGRPRRLQQGRVPRAAPGNAAAVGSDGSGRRSRPPERQKWTL